MTRRVLETVTRYEDKPDYKTAEQMTDNCCVDKPALPCREKMLSQQWGGYSVEHFLAKHGIVLDQYGRDAGGRYVEVRDVARKNPCGEEITRYQVEQKACCDFIEPMEWDFDNSAEVVAPGGMALVRVLGGAAPYRVSVRGEGFTLDGYRQRDGVYSTPAFWVFAESYSCGWCPIEVNDGCSIVRGGIRSTLGQWVLIAQNEPNLPCICGSNDNWESEYYLFNLYRHVCTNGRYRQEQYSGFQECDSRGPFPWCVPDGPWCFGIPCGTGDSCIWYENRWEWVC